MSKNAKPNRPVLICRSTRRYDFVGFDGSRAGEVNDNNSRSVDAVCLIFAKQIGREWRGYMHYRGPSQRVYAVAIVPGELPMCHWVAAGDRWLYEKRKRRTSAEARAAMPRTMLDEVRDALPVAGQIFYPHSIARRLGVHVNAVLPELRLLSDSIVTPILPKLRHGQRPPVLADLAWQRVAKPVQVSA